MKAGNILKHHLKCVVLAKSMAKLAGCRLEVVSVISLSFRLSPALWLLALAENQFCAWSCQLVIGSPKKHVNAKCGVATVCWCAVYICLSTYRILPWESTRLHDVASAKRFSSILLVAANPTGRVTPAWFYWLSQILLIWSFFLAKWFPFLVCFSCAYCWRTIGSLHCPYVRLPVWFNLLCADWRSQK